MRTECKRTKAPSPRAFWCRVGMSTGRRHGAGQAARRAGQQGGGGAQPQAAEAGRQGAAAGHGGRAPGRGVAAALLHGAPPRPPPHEPAPRTEIGSAATLPECETHTAVAVPMAVLPWSVARARGGAQALNVEAEAASAALGGATATAAGARPPPLTSLLPPPPRLQVQQPNQGGAPSTPSPRAMPAVTARSRQTGDTVCRARPLLSQGWPR